MTSTEENRKRALRAELRERRRTLTSTELLRAEEGLTANLRSLVTELGARSVACYLSTPTEPTTRPFLAWAAASGIRLLFPITRADGLLDWTEGESGEEAEGLLGMPERAGELLGPIVLGEVDLILVPAAAVDESGMRLGWGRGYFDKTLGSMGKCPPVYAVLYDHEVLPEVPREVHDQPVDGVVTPCRVIRF